MSEAAFVYKFRDGVFTVGSLEYAECVVLRGSLAELAAAFLVAEAPVAQQFLTGVFLAGLASRDGRVEVTSATECDDAG